MQSARQIRLSREAYRVSGGLKCRVFESASQWIVQA